MDETGHCPKCGRKADLSLPLGGHINCFDKDRPDPAVDPTDTDGWMEWLTNRMYASDATDFPYDMEQWFRHALESVEAAAHGDFADYGKRQANATLDRVLEVVPDECVGEAHANPYQESCCDESEHDSMCPKAIRAKVEAMRK